MEVVNQLIFFTALAALIALNGLLLLTIFTPLVKIWPTPVRDAWEFYTFWTLFRGGLGLTIVLAVLGFGDVTSHHWLGLALGGPLIVAGFGVTIYGYFDLGIENTYGANEGLVTSGLYQYSRNPQGVASMAGFLGLAIAGDSLYVAILSGLTLLVYALFPFAEEPWLERAYGEVYETYKAMTPRFLSLSKLLD